MGYIVLGLALGTPVALIGALLHLFSHAVMKGCLFLVVGGIRWRTGVVRIADYVGMGRRMPLTMAAFVVAGLAMIGLPPTVGFFSKWYLLSGAVEAGAWVFVAALVLSSLMGLVYFFRVFEAAYLKAPEGEQEGTLSRQELPLHMLAPILVLMAAVLIVGLLNQQVVHGIIVHALPGTSAP